MCLVNCRLSRATRTAEIAFGSLTSRFRVFHTAVNMRRKRIICVVLAACVPIILRQRANIFLHATSYVCMKALDTGEAIAGDWRLRETLDDYVVL